MQTKPSRLGQIVRFCFGGAAGVAAYFITLYFLTEYFEIRYTTSSVVAFVVNMSSNFLFHKFWTFKNKEKKRRVVGRQLVLYVAMILTFFGLNLLFLYLMVEYLHLWYIGAQGILTILFSVLSYFGTRWIFKKEKIDTRT